MTFGDNFVNIIGLHRNASFRHPLRRRNQRRLLPRQQNLWSFHTHGKSNGIDTVWIHSSKIPTEKRYECEQSSTPQKPNECGKNSCKKCRQNCNAAPKQMWSVWFNTKKNVLSHSNVATLASTALPRWHGVKPSRVGQDGPTHPPLKQNGHHCDNYYDVRYLNNCFSKPVLK